MIRKFFGIIRGIGEASDFEAYWMSLQRNGLGGAPTADEARRDYQAYVWSKSNIRAF